MGTVFSLSATIFQQPIAEISHVVGRKPAFLAVLAIFAIGSITAAMAKDMTTLLVGRSMQGFASGGSVLAAIVLTDLVDLRDRATWLSVQNSRWLFWINLPAIAASAAGLGVLLGFDRPAEGIWVGLRKVDWVGILIFMPSAVALLVPFTMAGIFFAWKSWQAIMSLLLGVGGLAALAVHQRYLAKNPMFRSSLFTKWTTVCSFFGQGVFGVCINMIFYYLVVFWSGVRGFDEILTGVALLPETLSIPVAAIVCGLTMRKTGRIRWAMLVGWPLTSLSIGLLWFLDTKTPLVALIVINTGVGLGAGIIASSLNVAILATTTREDNGHAMAMGWLFKSAGMCLGIAIGTALFSVQMESRLRQMDEPEMTAESLLRVLKNVKNDRAGQEAIVRTLRILWTICCGLSGLAGLLCGSCKYPTLNDRMQAQGDGAVKEDVESGRSSNCSSATQAKHPQHHVTVVDHGLPQTRLG
ncbi:major facilitator superfamily domain-containing protein [Lasiosphaeria ovina]|uniref:Major facilitator superfamily domain-containing protein n=1 Tax=Lasiosphaeria ovina TaxID=92902 RepID=A0AAE0NME0_9PEZI|nr:major facilitator superfamily domain-containing protein [Lasiosphaeria ovina]